MSYLGRWADGTSGGELLQTAVTLGPQAISLPGPETLSPPGPSASSQGSNARPVDHLQPAAAQRALHGLGHGGLQLSEPRTSETAGETPPQEPRVLNAPSRVSWAVARPV